MGEGPLYEVFVGAEGYPRPVHAWRHVPIDQDLLRCVIDQTMSVLMCLCAYLGAISVKTKGLEEFRMKHLVACATCMCVCMYVCVLTGVLSDQSGVFVPISVVMERRQDESVRSREQQRREAKSVPVPRCAPISHLL